VRRAQGAALRGRLVPGPRGPDGHTTWSAGPVQRRRAIETGDLLLSLDAAPKPDWTQRRTDRLPARDGAGVFPGLRGAGDAPKQPP
jgi:hypothetical protein